MVCAANKCLIDFAAGEKPMNYLQVEQEYGVSRRTIDNWRKAGLEWGLLGSKVYTSREAIQRFFKPMGMVQSVQSSDARAQDECAARLDELGV